MGYGACPQSSGTRRSPTDYPVVTVARAVLFGDPAIAPISGPVCDVLTAAKRDLRAGEVLDGIGGFTCYGMLENSDVFQAEGLLPMGLAGGCVVKRDIAKDEVLTYEDVQLPAGRLCDRLRVEQTNYFSRSKAPLAVS